MTADVLREAARLMRDRAEGAMCSCGGPVCSKPTHWYGIGELNASLYGTGPNGLHESAAHIASWNPAVALAVADWLDAAADDHDETPCPAIDAALGVAVAYLGTEAAS